MKYTCIFKARRRLLTWSALVVLAVFTVPLSADTVIAGDFSTGNPPFDPNTGDAWAVGTASSAELAVAFRDSSASSYVLTNIQLGNNFSVSDPNSATNPALNDLIVGIWQNTVDNPNTATELQSWSVAPQTTTGLPGRTYTLTSVTRTIINPADYYFITENVTPDGSNTAEWGWQENTLTPMQIGYYSGAYGTPGSLTYANNACTVNPCTAVNDPNASGTPAYSVSGTPYIPTAVPEPDCLLPLAGGLFVSIAWFRRRRRFLGAAGPHC